MSTVKPDMSEWENALKSAIRAMQQRSIAKAIRSGATTKFGMSAANYERSARRYERDVTRIADRALREVEPE